MAANKSGSGSPKAYKFEPPAYAKLCMHSCKHSSAACFGVLIGTGTGKSTNIVDAIPLFHTRSLAPMLKIAFMMIEQHCKSTGSEIVGLYHATTNGSTDIGSVRAIADKVASNCAGLTVWALDPVKLAARQFCLTGMYQSKDEWKSLGADAASVTAEVVTHTSRIISEMKYMDVIDFDDHLVNPASNWLNPTLFEGDPLDRLRAD
eukprot:TRINITY_DN76266_c0_g1_i1.p2 TRINITY_DN76266_c0_g1~~TRINITY_DN76266_c0_g1_i1.p2  ORF type:complete len:232 (+),score=34.23 TRINITY_DN76266_c0_g1_i1:82-696(+)